MIVGSATSAKRSGGRQMKLLVVTREPNRLRGQALGFVTRSSNTVVMIEILRRLLILRLSILGLPCNSFSSHTRGF